MAERGKRVKALENRPELRDYEAAELVAFNELCPRRQIGMVACPISTVDIEAWLNIYGFDGKDERVEIFRLVSVMDAEYMKHLKDKEDEEETNKKKKKKPNARKTRKRSRRN